MSIKPLPHSTACFDIADPPPQGRHENGDSSQMTCLYVSANASSAMTIPLARPITCAANDIESLIGSLDRDTLKSHQSTYVLDIASSTLVSHHRPPLTDPSINDENNPLKRKPADEQINAAKRSAPFDRIRPWRRELCDHLLVRRFQWTISSIESSCLIFFLSYFDEW